MIATKFITKTSRLAVTLALACAFGAPAMAQNDKMTPIAIPAQPKAIVLNTGALPGAARERHLVAPRGKGGSNVGTDEPGRTKHAQSIP